MRNSSRHQFSRRLRLLGCFLPGLAGSLLLGLPAASEADFIFTKIVDTNSAIPGGTGNFTGFSDLPAISGSTVAFFGGGSSGQGGIYTGTGGALTTIADKNTAIPGGTGNFLDFGFPAISGSTVAFFGGGSGGQAGIYTGTGGTPTTIADLNTAIPGGTGNFIVFSSGGSRAAISGSTVAFFGGGSGGQAGIYTGTGGPLTTIADKNTAIPGGTGNFAGFGDPAISGSTVVFTGGSSSGQAGIYTGTGGPLTTIADKNTAIPGGIGNFTGWGNGGISGSTVAFLAIGSGGQGGIYTGTGGTPTMIADKNTAIPGGTGNFAGFAEPAISGGAVAFLAIGSGGQGGIYADLGGTLTKVIAIGDPLDGKTVNNLSFGRYGLDDLAFWVSFTDESQGIFEATRAVPEPSSLLLLGTGLGGLGGLAWKRHRRE